MQVLRLRDTTQFTVLRSITQTWYYVLYRNVGYKKEIDSDSVSAWIYYILGLFPMK